MQPKGIFFSLTLNGIRDGTTRFEAQNLKKLTSFNVSFSCFYKFEVVDNRSS